MSKAIIAIAGSSGFIGAYLSAQLKHLGYEVWPIVRKPDQRPEVIQINIAKNYIDKTKLAQCHAVINLAGLNLMSGLWTKKFKQKLFDSRVKTTALLAQALAEIRTDSQARPSSELIGPQVFLSASAIGFYGDGQDRELSEQTPAGTGFLAELCQAWEQACQPAELAAMRVVNLRTGVVLARGGGLLKALEPMFKLGLGGPIGSGRQYLSPIAMEDEIAAIIFAIENENIKGPVNLVCPDPISNEHFSSCLAQVLNRPSRLRIPAFVLKLLGEQASLALSSTKVVPQKLLEAGFRFSYTNSHEILQAIYC